MPDHDNFNAPRHTASLIQPPLPDHDNFNAPRHTASLIQPPLLDQDNFNTTMHTASFNQPPLLENNENKHTESLIKPPLPLQEDGYNINAVRHTESSTEPPLQNDISIARKRKHAIMNTEKRTKNEIIPIYGIENKVIPPDEVRDQFLKIAYDQLTLMNQIMLNYQKEAQKLERMLQQMGGPVVQNYAAVTSSLECDLSSLTQSTNSTTTKHSKECESHSRFLFNERKLTENLINKKEQMKDGLVDQKDLSDIYKNNSGTGIFSHGFLFALPKGKKKFASKNKDITIDNVFENAGTLHFIFFSKFQGYRCKTGMYPHGTMSFSTFYKALQRFKRKTYKLYVYLPMYSYRNDFLLVINDCDNSKNFPWMKTIDFFESLPIDQKAGHGRHLNGCAVDFGMQGNQNCKREGNNLGIAIPGIKKGSLEEIPRNCFMLLSSFGKATVKVCEWDKLEQESDEYSQQFGHGNFLHLIRIGKSNYKFPISLHSDGPNSQDNPDVYAISCIVHDFRYAVNGQNKNSISQAIDRTKRQQRCITDMIQLYGNITNERKEISKNLFDTKYHINIFGINICRNQCHLNMAVGIQPVIHGVLALTQKLHLNFDEIVALHLASIFTPNCKIFLGLLARSLHQLLII